MKDIHFMNWLIKPMQEKKSLPKLNKNENQQIDWSQFSILCKEAMSKEILEKNGFYRVSKFLKEVGEFYLKNDDKKSFTSGKRKGESVLIQEALDHFKFLQVGDVFDLTCFGLRNDAKADHNRFRYYEDEDVLTFGSVTIYSNGLWAKKVGVSDKQLFFTNVSARPNIGLSFRSALFYCFHISNFSGFHFALESRLIKSNDFFIFNVDLMNVIYQQEKLVLPVYRKGDDFYFSNHFDKRIERMKVTSWVERDISNNGEPISGSILTREMKLNNDMFEIKKNGGIKLKIPKK